MNDMKSKEPVQLQVYYDGLCELCSREIAHYKKQKGSEKIDFIDIFSKNFNAEELGLNPKEIHKNLHAIALDGRILSGTDTFIAIWSLLPKYQFLAKQASKPLIHKGFKKIYFLFTKIRPYLPRKNEDSCAQSPYCEYQSKKP